MMQRVILPILLTLFHFSAGFSAEKRKVFQIEKTSNIQNKQTKTNNTILNQTGFPLSKDIFGVLFEYLDAPSRKAMNQVCKNTSQRIAQRTKYIKIKKDTDCNDFIKVLDKTPNIQVLDLSFSIHLNSLILENIHQKYPQLTTLIINGCCFDWSEQDYLSLEKFTSLKKLIFQKNLLGENSDSEETLETKTKGSKLKIFLFCESIQKCISLEELDLSNNNLHTSECYDIVSDVKTLQRLKKLNFSHNQLDELAIYYIAEYLKNFPQLTHLNLSNAFSPPLKSFLFFPKLFLGERQLEKIILNDNGLKDDFIDCLNDLKDIKSAKKISLKNNNFTKQKKIDLSNLFKDVSFKF